MNVILLFNYRSARVLRKCLFHTLERHCSADAWEFFKIVFDSELAPPMKYMNCREGMYNIYHMTLRLGVK